MMTTYKTIICAILLSLLLMGCTRTTFITKPDGEVWEVKHSKDALIEYAKGDEKVTIDDRGRASLIEEIIKIWTIRELNNEED